MIVRGLGSRYYDGEGISARRIPIVEAGALSNLFVDSYYGRKIERDPTTGGASNLVVAPGDRNLEAILGDVEEGYLVTSWLGGNSDATTGDFSLGMRGHLIENGEVGGAVQEMKDDGSPAARSSLVASDEPPPSRSVIRVSAADHRLSVSISYG